MKIQLYFVRSAPSQSQPYVLQVLEPLQQLHRTAALPSPLQQQCYAAITTVVATRSVAADLSKAVC